MAIACGPSSGLLVLDIDEGKGGRESLRRLERLHGPLPRGLTAITGGGRHRYFRFPTKLHGELKSTGQRSFTTGANVAGHRGLDFRGDGGFVVAPPSVHANGRPYRWSPVGGDLVVPEPPTWVLAVLLRPARRLRRRSSPLPDGIAPTSCCTRYGLAALAEECGELARARHPGRNDALNRAAFAIGRLVSGGEIAMSVAQSELLRAAHEAAAASAPEPFTELEIHRTLRSGLDSGQKAPRSAPPGDRR